MPVTTSPEDAEGEPDQLPGGSDAHDDAEEADGPLPRRSTAEIRTILSGLSAADWERVDRIAKRHSAGLHHLTPRDLRQQAAFELMEARRWPPDVHPVIVLANAMHSIASNERKRAKASPIDAYVEVDPFETNDEDDEPGKRPVVLASTGVTPEDVASGKDQFEALCRLLEGDNDLQDLAMAWAFEVRGKEAEAELKWDGKKYDRERKRLIRRLDALDPDRRSK